MVLRRRRLGRASISSGAGGSSLATLAASMSAGQWSQLTVTGLTTSLFTAGSGNTLDYMDKFCWDEMHQQIRGIGQGHLDDQRYHQFDAASNTWSNIADPPWDTGGSGYPGFDGHGYEHNAMDPATGDHYYRMYGSTTIRRLTRATGTWDTIAAHTGSGSVATGALEWLPSIGTQGGLILTLYDMVQRWDKQTDTWSSAGTITARGNHPIAWRSKPNSLVLFGGGNGDNNLYSVGGSGGVTSRTACPITMSCTDAVNVTCPVSGDLIVINGNSSARKYSVAGDSWSTLTMPGTPSFATAIGPGARIIATPITDLGVISFMFGATSEHWLYRHA